MANIENQIRIIQEIARERGIFISSEQAEWVLNDIDLEKMDENEIFMTIEHKLW